MFQPENSFVFRNAIEQSSLSHERAWSAHVQVMVDLTQSPVIRPHFTVEASDKVLTSSGSLRKCKMTHIPLCHQ